MDKSTKKRPSSDEHEKEPVKKKARVDDKKKEDEDEDVKQDERRARWVPFDPARAYWLVTNVEFDGGGVKYYLFDPASVPEEREREILANRLDNLSDNFVPVKDDLKYHNASEYLCELDITDYTERNMESNLKPGSLYGDFAKMPPKGTAITITRVLTAFDHEY